MSKLLRGLAAGYGAKKLGGGCFSTVVPSPANVASAPAQAGNYPRTNFLYLILCGWSASAPLRLCRSASYSL